MNVRTWFIPKYPLAVGTSLVHGLETRATTNGHALAKRTGPVIWIARPATEN